MKTKFSLQNQKVIITGGGSGIGKAIAKTFGTQGADVHILDINTDKGK
jgi:NAD(P)-dependent dehydrogenase (short-subunit alcohol dehydrogenase family)